MITNVPATGDAAFDATLRIWTDLINKGKTLHVTMASQIKPLNEQEFLSVVASKAALKAEMDKKVSAQKLIEKCHQELTATVEEARQAVRALKLRREMERRELSSMETGGKFCSYIDSSYSLASQRQKAELDLYEFLWSESGRYRVANRQVLFTSEPKLQEFRRLTERIRGITEEAQQLERQREAGAQGVRDQLQQSLQ